MKKLFVLLAALMMLLTCAFAETVDNDHTARIILDANPTTGFSWTAFIISGDAVALDSPEGVYTQDSGNAIEVDGEMIPACGAGGQTVYTLTAIQPGQSVIVFTYLRPWEQDFAEKAVYLAVVDEDMMLYLTDITAEGVLTGTATDIDEAGHTAAVSTDTIGEVTAQFPEDMALPVAGEQVLLYTDGTMTMSLPAIVNVLYWEAVPSGLARTGLSDAEAEDQAAEPALQSFGEMTGFDDFIASHVSESNPVIAAYFTEGYGFSTAEFTTEDSDEILQLLDAVAQLEIDSVSNMSITDWYPLLTFTCRDGSTWGVRFEGHWLSVGPTNYSLQNDSTLWQLTKQLETKYLSE